MTEEQPVLRSVRRVEPNTIPVSCFASTALLGAVGRYEVGAILALLRTEQEAISNKCIATSNKCLTSSNKKLLAYCFYYSFLLLLVRHLLLVAMHLFLIASYYKHRNWVPSSPFRSPGRGLRFDQVGFDVQQQPP